MAPGDFSNKHFICSGLSRLERVVPVSSAEAEGGLGLSEFSLPAITAGQAQTKVKLGEGSLHAFMLYISCPVTHWYSRASHHGQTPKQGRELLFWAAPSFV